MNFYKQAYLSLLVCCFSLQTTFSQSYLSKSAQGPPYANTGQLGFTIGPTIYAGELNSANFSLNESTSLAASFYGQYHISNVFGFRIQLLGGFLNGGTRTTIIDKEIIQESFSGVLLDGNISGIVNISNLISPYKPTRKFFFYGLLGVGYAGWYSSLINKVYDFDSLETDNPLQNFNASPMLPVGMGLQYRIGKRVSLGLEYTARFYFSDMLDNTAGTYKNDIVHYVSFSLALNLGTGKKRPKSIKKPEPLLPDPYVRRFPVTPPPVKDPSPPPPPPRRKPVKSFNYVVQIFAFSHHKYTPQWIKEKYHIPISVRLERDGNVYRYLVGNCNNLLCANELRNQMIQAGVRDAFIVAYKNGVRDHIIKK